MEGAFFWLYWIPGSPGIWRCSGRQMAVRGYVIYGTRQVLRDRTLPQDRDSAGEKQVMWDMEKCRMDLPLGRNIPRREINAALQMPALDRYRLIPSRDLSGHGTAVAGIAAGKSADGFYAGAPPRRN